jgi:hypothetical protein
MASASIAVWGVFWIAGRRRSSRQEEDIHRTGREGEGSHREELNMQNLAWQSAGLSLVWLTWNQQEVFRVLEALPV